MLTDEQCFARALEAFDGRWTPTDGAASKMLCLMFKPPSCDATITPRGFTVHVGPAHEPWPYASDVAPAVVSWLLAAAGARRQRDIRASLGPTEIPSIAPFFAWATPARHLWMSAHADMVSIRLRDTVEALDAPLPIRPGR